ncbi:Nucleic acid-binding protein [Corchorus olitorius]|uniref:Nucleic acid-binding protein n=1 Tax=Corchorus olitorius TaxID=93759 RepID=A0A1R3HBY6_9ROSI|nr:Nucleic acid-binding protein [Corchorus olitorius]
MAGNSMSQGENCGGRSPLLLMPLYRSPELQVKWSPWLSLVMAFLSVEVKLHPVGGIGEKAKDLNFCLTIWEQSLKPQAIRNLGRKPVIALAGTIVKEFSVDTKYLSSCSVTKVYFDLEIPDTERVRNMYIEDISPVEFVSAEEAANAQAILEAMFGCVIFSLDQKIVYDCSMHGLVTPKFVMQLCVFIEDDTASIEVAIFGGLAEKLIGVVLNKVIPKSSASLIGLGYHLRQEMWVPVMMKVQMLAPIVPTSRVPMVIGMRIYRLPLNFKYL